MTAYDLTNNPHYKGLAFHAEALEYRAKNKLQESVDKNILGLKYTQEGKYKDTISKYISLDLNELRAKSRCHESFDKAIGKRYTVLQFTKDQIVKSETL